MLGAHAGEVAALGTAFCWAMTALFFAAAGRRIGSLVVNLVRLLMGFAFLAAAGAVLRDHPLPTDASRHTWTYLLLSGLAGFVAGDLCLFRAFIVLGPRLSTLVMSTSPMFAALMGYAWLDERLTAVDGIGMALTLAGVTWAALERRPEAASPASAANAKGILLALGGSVGQAAGLILSKHGMQGYDAFSSTQIRVIAGIAGFSLVFMVRGWHHVRKGLTDRKALAQTAMGAFFGPFLGVTMSLVAVRHAKVGVAASLMATTPIMILPIIIWYGREHVGPGGILGAIIAVAGVATLFLA